MSQKSKSMEDIVNLTIKVSRRNRTALAQRAGHHMMTIQEYFHYLMKKEGIIKDSDDSDEGIT